jgi:DNA end-binding protein Ku
VPDLMDALQQAVENVRAGRNVRTQPESENGGDGELDELSRDELYERAQKKKIPGRTKMSKKELAKALSE